MMRLFIVVATIFAMLTSSALADSRFRSSGILAKIDLSSQRMKVYQNGRLKYVWKVSTARRGYRTPLGTYRPTRMYKRYFSKKYYNSPMPNAIFFRGGYAIHGTNAERQLGRVASHGCVRLSRKNAKKLYALVKKNGRKRTLIKIVR